MNLSKQLPVLVVLFFVAGTACTDLFNKSDNTPQLEFSANAPTEYPAIFNGDTLIFRVPDPGELIDSDDVPPFISEVAGNQILIEGYFYMTCSHNNSMKGSISRSGDTIKIEVKAGTPDGFCPDVPSGGRIYNAAISELDSGSYKVKIVHKNDFLRSHYPGTFEVFEEEFVVE